MFGNQVNLNKLKRQRDELDNWINSMENMQQTPVNNIINTNQPQTPQNNLVEWRILNENEQLDNLYVKNKTLFIGANLMVLKDVNGNMEKWEINKIYPVDEKEQKIKALEEEIKQLKEMISNELPKPIKSINTSEQSSSNVNGNDKSTTTKSSKSVQK